MTSEDSKPSADHLPRSSGTDSRSRNHLAASLRGFGPVGVITILLILITGNVFTGNLVFPIGALLVLLWTRLSETRWPEIGYVRPKSWIVSSALGITFGIAFKFLMKAIVMPLLGADPINHAYHYLAGNRTLLPAAVWAMFVAGFGEETVFRGYSFERLSKLFGTAVVAKIAIVILTSAWFGLAHYTNQGIEGVEQATIVGLIFGTIFAVTGEIWMLMFAHTAFDLTALAMIFWNLESTVAHLIFK